MKPTRTMDIRAQVILDSRSLATIARYFMETNTDVSSISDLIRKAINSWAYQLNQAGYMYVKTREEAQSILEQFSQRDRGFTSHPAYISPVPPNPRPNSFSETDMADVASKLGISRDELARHLNGVNK